MNALALMSEWFQRVQAHIGTWKGFEAVRRVEPPTAGEAVIDLPQRGPRRRDLPDAA